jgi:hypothetical protein
MNTGLAWVDYADVVKLVDTLDLGSSAARCESSSLSVRTIYLYNYLIYKDLFNKSIFDTLKNTLIHFIFLQAFFAIRYKMH